MCISWSCTFWVVKGEGQGHPSRSNVKYMASVRPSENFNIGHNLSHGAEHYEWWKVKVKIILQGQMSNIWRLSVRPKTLTLAITFSIFKIATWYFACMCISWSCTFWVVKGEGQGHPSRSNVKDMVSVRPSENFNIGHHFFNIEDSNLIFGMHVYLMELHILEGERSRSRSSFKVKGQGQRSNFAISKIVTWYVACMCISWSCTFWVVKGQGHPSRLRSKVNFAILKIATWYLAFMHISWSCTFRVVKGHPSRSRVKFCNIEDSNSIFCMHGYLMELNIMSGERSRSSFKVKVKGQILQY